MWKVLLGSGLVLGLQINGSLASTNYKFRSYVYTQVLDRLEVVDCSESMIQVGESEADSLCGYYTHYWFDDKDNLYPYAIDARAIYASRGTSVLVMRYTQESGRLREFVDATPSRMSELFDNNLFNYLENWSEVKTSTETSTDSFSRWQRAEHPAVGNCLLAVKSPLPSEKHLAISCESDSEPAKPGILHLLSRLL